MSKNVDVLSVLDERIQMAAPMAADDLREARWIVAELIIELQQSVVQLEMAAECIEANRYDEALLHASSLMRSKRKAIARAKGEA